MSPELFSDLQEALLYVFAPALVVLAGIAFAGSVVAAIIATAMEIFHGGRGKRGF